MAGVDINRTSLGLSLPTPVVGEIIAKAREESLVMRKAQRKQLPNGATAVGISGGVTGSKFVGETARKPIGTATYSEKVMRAYKIALILSFSDEFRRDRASLYRVLVQDMPKDLAATFDKAFFFGEGAPIGDFDTLATAPSVALGTDPYKGLLGTLSTSAAAGGSISEFDLSPAGEVNLLGQKDANGYPLFVNGATVSTDSLGTVLGRPVVGSKNVAHAGTPPTVGFAMDWDSVFWGMVEGIRYEETGNPIFTDAGTLVHAGRQDNMFSVICEVEIGVRTLDVNRHVRLTA